MTRLSRLFKPYLTPQNLVTGYGVFLLSAYLLWTPPEGYSNIVTPKHWAFMGSFALLLVSLLILGAIRAGAWLRTPDRPRIPTKKPPVTVWFAGGILVWVLISTLCSPWPETAWWGDRRNEGFFTLWAYYGLFLLGTFWFRPGQLWAMGASLAGLGNFVLALLQFLGYNPLSLYPGTLTFHHRGTHYSGEYMGTIGNSDLLSAVLTVLVLFLIGAYIKEKSPWRWLFLAGALGAWGALLLSEVLAGPVAILGCLGLLLPVCISKGVGLRHLGEIAAGLSLLALGKSCLAYDFTDETLTLSFQWTWVSAALAVAAAMSLGAVQLLRRLPEGQAFPRVGRGWWIGYGALALGSVLFLFCYAGSNETLQGLSGLLHGEAPDTLGSSRIAIWKDAVALGLDKPLLGGGPDTYNFRSDLTFSREISPGNIRTTSVDAAHNEYLNLWVNCGLPAMVLQLALVLGAILPALRRLDLQKLPLALPVVGYGIHALFGISQSVSSPLFYLMLGALVAVCRGQEEPLPHPIQESPCPAPESKPEPDPETGACDPE